MSRLILGEFAHLLAGGTLGPVILLLFLISGFRYGLIKGVGFGAIMWIVHVAVIPNLVTPRPYIFRTVNEAYADLFGHMVWGFITAYILIICLGKESTSEKERKRGVVKRTKKGSTQLLPRT